MNPESTPLAPSTQSPPSHHAPTGGFRNPWPGSTPTGFSGLFRWAIERSRQTRPPAPPPPRLHTPAVVQPRATTSDLRVTAIGHSTFLLQIGGLNILTDPVFGERASPLPFAGPRRRHPPGLALEALPPIDLVLQSHDHYDHLDDAAVRHIARAHPAATWCAPLGVAARLRERGVREIIERDWWGTAHAGAASVTCVPAAHFSGRTPFDRDRTLWCGWAVTIGAQRIYFVGDTGFHPIFPEIGERLGPCDMVFMPVGAYEPRWFMKPVHLDPDEALEAFAGLTRAHATHPTVMVAMHWGTFTLTDEPMDEPTRRTEKGWAERGWPADRLWILNPGETRAVSSAR